jgi:hypothetical protein
VGGRGLVTPAHTLGDLDRAVSSALATVHRRAAATASGEIACARFSGLVDDLLQRH